jgi:hypothetical protein
MPASFNNCGPPAQEVPPHLGADSVRAPGGHATLVRDDALCSQPPPKYRCDSSRCRIRRRPAPVQCVFARKPLRRQQADSRNRSTHHGARAAQHELLVQIDHDYPLQPSPPLQQFLPVMVHTSHIERADRSLRQVHRIAGSPRPFLRVSRNRRIVSPTARSTVWSPRRCRKRYPVVKSGTLTSPGA